MDFDFLLTNGLIIDGTGKPAYSADVGIIGDTISQIGNLIDAKAIDRIDVTGKVIAPGLIDAHVHGDLILLFDPLHEPAIRQGVTTYILGQDGVAMAPASETTLQYMRRYTAGFNGNFPTPMLSWSSLSEYLSKFDGRCAINAACLIPNGNIRMEVMGLETRAPTSDELKRMQDLIQQAMNEGAVGLSTGLDYIPSRYANTDELIELCKVITKDNGVYVSHIRGYAPETVIPAMEEIERIGKEAQCPVHISHFNGLADQVIPKLDAMIASGIDATFDLYCYLFGSTILGMIALPPEIQEGGIEATLERLRDPSTRNRSRDWFTSPRIALEDVRLGSVPHPEYESLEGQTLEFAAKVAQKPIGDLVCDILLATEMATNCIVPHNPRRTNTDIEKLMRHPTMMGGSDGIYVGGKPHPRGTGCFARYLGYYVRNGIWSLEEAIAKCSGNTAKRFQLNDRGFIQEGKKADVIVFDPSAIADQSTFEDGKALAVGMDHVLVNGSFVLRDGTRTINTPGRGLRRS